MEYKFYKNSNIQIDDTNTDHGDTYQSDINLRSLSERKSKIEPRSYPIEIVDCTNFQKAAKTLQISFVDDDFTNYLTKSIENLDLKRKIDMALFEASVFASILDGVLVAIRDTEQESLDPQAAFLAVACFTRPSMDSGFWNRVYNGNFCKDLIEFESINQRVFHEQFPILDKTKTEILRDEEANAWYLGDLGTLPLARGKGCAKALLQYVYESFIDKGDGSICYLESSHPVNRLFYEKMGFTFVKKLQVGHIYCDCVVQCDDKPLMMDIMVRGIKGTKWVPPVDPSE